FGARLASATKAEGIAKAVHGRATHAYRSNKYAESRRKSRGCDERPPGRGLLVGRGVPVDRGGRVRWLVLAELFHEHEQRRNEKDAEQGGRGHTGDHRGAEDFARRGAGARCRPERQAAENEGERRHEDRAEAQPSALERRFDERFARVVAFL